MQRYLLRRFAFAILTLVASTALVFSLTRAAGDPVLMYATPGYGRTPEQIDAIKKWLGLDKPLVVQYFIWLGNTIKGDLGNQIVTRQPVVSVIRTRIFWTMQLGLAAWIWAVAVGIPLGILSAVKRGTVFDYIGRSFALLGQALPSFWVGMMAILMFAVILGWLPVSTAGPTNVHPLSWAHIKFFIMPALTLGWFVAASLLRLTRSAMLEILDSEYVKFARAKGVSEWKVIWKHAFRNAVLQPLTLAATTLAGFIGGAVVIERVFAWPGVGRLALEAVWNTDYPTLTAVVLLWTLGFVVMNFIADLMYAYLDPRVRYG
ncbi:MAG: ABC transporter permease [Chloroflexota bacterium]|nr:ABC transporter permease [Chloroflexota bacterium]